MRRRAALLVASLVAWSAGSVLGALNAEGPVIAAPRPLLVLGQAHAGYVPTLDGTSPIFILFIGSDARPNEKLDATRADSIHLVSINPAKHRASILGIPRDSWVEIPGYGSNKINASLTEGGPELTVQTVEALTGIKIDYWALTGFSGFEKMIDQIGGVTVDVPFALNDPSSRASFEPGTTHMDGNDALAFSRDRHDLPSGDFGRSENQGRVFLSILHQYRQQFRKEPSVLFTYIGAGMRNVRTTVPLDQVLALAFTASAINPKAVENMVVPGTNGMEGTLSVVFISPEAQVIYDDLKNDGLVAKKHVPGSPNASLLD